MRYLGLLLIFSIFSPVRPQGRWSSWGNWSPCSRSCGGGITYQERKCSTKNCVGESKNINSCNIQDCLNGNGDFRKEQCAKFNSIPYKGVNYNWVPYYGGISDNPCALNCMPKGHFFAVALKAKVVDGTRCNTSTYNMCFDGVCKKAGCDLIIGSDVKEDKCRVCNGRERNCRTIKDVYKSKTKLAGYADVLAIPAGATNVLINDETLNFLALKNSTFSYILNGGLQIMWSRKIKAAGNTVKYQRKRKSESIFVRGPTSQILYLAVLLDHRLSDISISYEYSIPTSLKLKDYTIKYSWKVGNYGECSKPCNGGEKTRRVYCVRSRDSIEVDNNHCNVSIKPEESISCNTDHCAPRWFIDSWGPCSKTCGEGIHVRRVHCEQETEDGVRMISDDLCPGNKEITQRKCVEKSECPKWSLGEWSECSKTCGGGTRTRAVRCMESNNNAIHDDDKCPIYDKPFEIEPCGQTPCNVRWAIREWGSCFPKCGEGMRSRSVYCASSIIPQRRYPDYMCDIAAKPSTTINCTNTQECPPMWYGSSWSKCTTRCGKGLQMRNVFCGVKRQERKLLHILPESTCQHLPPLKKMQHCKVKPCHTQWITSAWKECSSTCGGGKTLRNVKCYADSEEDKTGKSCDPKQKPPTEDICNLVDCITDAITTNKLTELTTEPTLPQTTKYPRGPRISTKRPTRPPTERLTRPVVTTIITRRPVATRGPLVTQESLATTSFPPTNPVSRGTNEIGGKSMAAEITEGPANAEVVVGSDVIMICKATGNPKPSIFWMKGNLDVSIIGPRFQTLPNGSLRIEDVQQVDGGFYTCVATNGVNQRITSEFAILKVTTPPYVDITLGYTVKEGREAVIKCDVTGKPTPTVQWFKDDIELQVQDTDRATVTPQRLTIRKASLEDQGKYVCQATNRNGVRTAQMMLDVYADKKTRMHEIMNGSCQDQPEFANCSRVASIEGYCDMDYYQKICCQSCRNKL